MMRELSITAWLKRRGEEVERERLKEELREGFQLGSYRPITLERNREIRERLHQLDWNGSWAPRFSDVWPP